MNLNFFCVSLISALCLTSSPLWGQDLTTPFLVSSKEAADTQARPRVEPTSSHDVIIIGAGLSGITAARRLRALGHEVLVLEAKEYVGGRALTDHRFSAPIDLGASWIHGADLNPLTPAVDALGFTRVESDLGGPVFIGKNRLSGSDLELFYQEYERFEQRLKLAARAQLDTPISQHLDHNFKYRLLIGADTGPLDNGAEADQTSTVEAAAFRADPDDLIAEGVGTFVQRLSEGVPIQLMSPVTEVLYQEGGRVLVLADKAGKRVAYQAHRVVVTVSTGVLAAQKIKFTPRLPDWKWEAIRALPMGLLNKVVIQLREGGLSGEKSDQWVLAQSNPSSIRPGEQTVKLTAPSVMSFLVKPHGAPLIIGFYGADQARHFEERGAEAALAHAKGTLTQMYGAQFSSFVDDARSAVTEWGKDPWTLGSYSAALPHQSSQHAALARPVADKVFFAGEACGPPELNGSLGAAYVSGLSAARAVHHSLSTTQEGGLPAH